MQEILNHVTLWAHHVAFIHGDSWVEVVEVAGSITAAILSLVMSFAEFCRGHLGMGLLFLVLTPVAFVFGAMIIVGVIVFIVLRMIAFVVLS